MFRYCFIFWPQTDLQATWHMCCSWHGTHTPTVTCLDSAGKGFNHWPADYVKGAAVDTAHKTLLCPVYAAGDGFNHCRLYDSGAAVSTAHKTLPCPFCALQEMGLITAGYMTLHTKYYYILDAAGVGFRHWPVGFTTKLLAAVGSVPETFDVHPATLTLGRQVCGLTHLLRAYLTAVSWQGTLPQCLQTWSFIYCPNSCRLI